MESIYLCVWDPPNGFSFTCIYRDLIFNTTAIALIEMYNGVSPFVFWSASPLQSFLVNRVIFSFSPLGLRSYFLTFLYFEFFKAQSYQVCLALGWIWSAGKSPFYAEGPWFRRAGVCPSLWRAGWGSSFFLCSGLRKMKYITKFFVKNWPVVPT